MFVKSAFNLYGPIYKYLFISNVIIHAHNDLYIFPHICIFLGGRVEKALTPTYQVI